MSDNVCQHDLSTDAYGVFCNWCPSRWMLVGGRVHGFSQALDHAEAEIARLRALLRGCVEALEKVEYASDGWCGACQSHTSNMMDRGHEPGCVLRTALAAARKELGE